MEIETSVNIADQTITLLSEGTYSEAKENIEVSINIDGSEYVENVYGINIVVLDNETGLVIDSVGFTPVNDENINCVRTRSLSLLKNYEHEQYNLEGKEG